jgi:hypothetical protein
MSKDNIERINRTVTEASEAKLRRLEQQRQQQLVQNEQKRMLAAIREPEATPLMVQPTQEVLRTDLIATPQEDNSGKSVAVKSDEVMKALFSNENCNFPAPPGDWIGLYTPGLHLLYGPAGSGKSVNALALAGYLLSTGHYVEYHNVMEPRGAFFNEKGIVNDPAAAKLNQKRGLREIPKSYSSWLLNDVLPRSRSAVKGTLAPVVILDSITYLIRSLAMTQAALAQKGAPTGTYAGGLQYGDTLGIIHHNQIATYYNTCLIAVVNSDLFPPIADLSGAVEGIMRSVDVGTLTITSRPSGRKQVTERVPRSYTSSALERMYAVPKNRLNSIASGYTSMKGWGL